jgi:hypothetical protein
MKKSIYLLILILLTSPVFAQMGTGPFGDIQSSGGGGGDGGDKFLVSQTGTILLSESGLPLLA